MTAILSSIALPVNKGGQLRGQALPKGLEAWLMRSYFSHAATGASSGITVIWRILHVPARSSSEAFRLGQAERLTHSGF
jgi:hypothetical protein